MHFLRISLLLLIITCASQKVFGSKIQMTYEKVKTQIEKGIQISDDPSAFCSQYLRNYVQSGFFKSKDDWRKSLSLIEKKSKKYQDESSLRVTTLITRRLQNEEMFQDAYYYLIKANDLRKNAEIRDERLIQWLNIANAHSSYYFNKFNEAEKYFLAALEYKLDNPVDSISIYNTLGMIQHDLKNTEKSNIYYLKGLEIAKRHNIREWIALISGNTGLNYFDSGDYNKARELLVIDYNISSTIPALESSKIPTLQYLIGIDIKESKLEQATSHFEELEELVRKFEKPSTLLYLYRTKTELLETKGDFKGALEAFRLYNKYHDIVNQAKDREALLRTEFQVNFEQQSGNVRVLQEKKKKSDIIMYSLILFIFFAVLLIYQITKRWFREREISRKEKEQMDKELVRTELEMRKVLNSLMKKNEIIDLLNEELETIQVNNDDSNSEEKRRIKDQLQSFTLLTDDDWIEFKKLFEIINPEFFNKVGLKFSQLSNAEIRLVTLIKLNLSNTEIARALGISPDSVRKANFRLRKKLEIDEKEDLVKFVLSI